jgi:hypothetical protein
MEQVGRLRGTELKRHPGPEYLVDQFLSQYAPGRDVHGLWGSELPSCQNPETRAALGHLVSLSLRRRAAGLSACREAGIKIAGTSRLTRRSSKP